MQQRKEEGEGELEDETDAEMEREKKIPRSEAGTEEKATPGMVVVVVVVERGRKNKVKLSTK